MIPPAVQALIKDKGWGIDGLASYIKDEQQRYHAMRNPSGVDFIQYLKLRLALSRDDSMQLWRWYSARKRKPQQALPS